ncbi:MAG: glutamate-5-semialdehyde dehydrogenase [Oscillospiraceae bacterium]|nr:glutamate-5-semialdehyde dehydrogenase [Oscillospiraceae bacterium]
MTYIETLGFNAKNAQKQISTIKTAQKNAVLELIAKRILENAELIKTENKKDIEIARANGKSEAYIDRLTFTDARIAGMAEGVREVAALADPIGEVLGGGEIQDGLTIIKRRVALGVVGIIFESRPNVTVDAAVLCLKSGNVCILRGGSDAINSNKCLTDLMRKALKDSGIDENAIALVENTSRETANEMMKLQQYIDVLIPRGGEGLKKVVTENSTIPVIFAAGGICHVYVDESADLDMALEITDNAKTQRPSVCNAIETVIIHEKIKDEFVLMLEKRWNNKVEIVYDDYDVEFLDYKISVKIVNNIDEAIEHINNFGTKHSEAIVTNDLNNALKFQNEVDAAAVYVNASTRFTDGNVFGLGAEIGITTQKLHARGPMGLKELTTYKYLVNGTGQIRK